MENWSINHGNFARVARELLAQLTRGILLAWHVFSVTDFVVTECYCFARC